MKAFVASKMKDMNRKTVFKYLSTHEETSKAEIAKETGISAPTVIKIVNFLLEKNLIIELGEGESALGRKPQMLALNKDVMYFVCFFIEGDFLTIAVMNMANEVVAKQTMEIVCDLNQILYRITFEFIDGIFQKAKLPIEKLRGIGIAIPGIYDATMNKILTAPLLGIQEEYDISMQLDFMQKRYPVPIIVENDTNAQCFGEYCAQNLSNKDDLVFISLGTGIGAGLIIQGKLRHGIHNMCGEIGYMAFMDDYVSGYEQPGWLESKIGYRALKEEFGFSLEEDNLNLNKKETALMIDYITPFITLCINNIVMLLDTANIVLGGIIVNRLGDQLIENVNLKVKELCINKVTIKKQTCSDIGLMGLSAVLANQTILNILEED